MTTEAMKLVFAKPESVADVPYSWCGGCTHGISQRLIAEALDELGIREESIAIVGIGCYGGIRMNLEVDAQQILHGRAPAQATGLKRCHPDKIVFTVQGDGDLAAIGTTEIIHAAVRGERISTFFLNNGNYGMTGGQMAPTTLIGQNTTTTPGGREPMRDGFPSVMTEMLALSPGTAYAARVSLHNPANVNRAKKAIKRAFQTQMAGLGFSVVEILSACPSSWRKTPLDALKFIEEKMIPAFPLGDLKAVPLPGDAKEAE